MVLSTTGVICASVIITACLMESAAKTLNPNAQQVRLFSPEILKHPVTGAKINDYCIDLNLQTQTSTHLCF